MLELIFWLLVAVGLLAYGVWNYQQVCRDAEFHLKQLIRDED